MHTIRTKADIEVFLNDLQWMIKEDGFGTFIFKDSKNNHSEHITQLRYSDDMWSALYSSETYATEWIDDIEEWVWTRRKDINKEIRKWDFNVIPIKCNFTFDVPKRNHFKGRGDTERPTCPHCQKDLKRSYTLAEDWKKGKVPYGWNCRKCKYQTFD